MADTIEFDLTSLRSILHERFEPRSDRVGRVIFEFSISPNIIAALLADDTNGISDVVIP